MIPEICFLSVLIFLLFWTDALISYFEYFNLTRFLPDYIPYKDIVDLGGHVNYLRYLNISTDIFLLKLVSCPICLSFYLSLFICLGEIASFPILCFFSWVGFFVLKILNKYSS